MTSVQFDLQPSLSNDVIKLEPLKNDDFERLYTVASDPLIWEQHPNKNRYQRSVFETFFTGAMESGGAFLISDIDTGEVLGSSRFYDLYHHRVMIGYTFLSRSCWGKGINRSLKTLMLDHAFQFVDEVLFHVGSGNMRSRKAMEKLGAIQVGEENIQYYGESPVANVVFAIRKENWKQGV